MNEWSGIIGRRVNWVYDRQGTLIVVLPQEIKVSKNDTLFLPFLFIRALEFDLPMILLLRLRPRLHPRLSTQGTLDFWLINCLPSRST
jgi:hypothetical protein